MTAGAVVSTAASVYGVVDRVTESGAKVIAAACADYAAKKQVSAAKIMLGAANPMVRAPLAQHSAIASFGDAACDPSRPPPGDPLMTAVWLGGLGQQLVALTKT